MNPAALHLDFDYAEKETQFGRPLVNSMFTAALVVGISVHETTHGTTVANLGFEEMNFPAPVFHGDTIRVESEVVSSRESSSKPDQGLCCSNIGHTTKMMLWSPLCVATPDVEKACLTPSRKIFLGESETSKAVLPSAAGLKIGE